MPSALIMTTLTIPVRTVHATPELTSVSASVWYCTVTELWSNPELV